MIIPYDWRNRIKTVDKNSLVILVISMIVITVITLNIYYFLKEQTDSLQQTDKQTQILLSDHQTIRDNQEKIIHGIERIQLLLNSTTPKS